ncbi:hypothetical protein MP228_011887 [Amoeboaphelidium protococcarum]|nr:hypothetical protein MP228_011887 [Amoeboaphelidium protococcarum]
MSNSATFQVVSDLSDIYPRDSVEAQKLRFQTLKEEFAKRYDGQVPMFIARSPGRVNLIGEHIDYSDYSVLPMALADKDILIAVGVNSGTNNNSDKSKSIRVSNMNSEKFPSRQFTIQSSSQDYLAIDASKHEWSNYFLAGMKGILMHLKVGDGDVIGFNCLVDGTVPDGAGVSSSSAFVCCSALACYQLYKSCSSSTQLQDVIKQIDKLKLTEIAIRSERFVGVNSGGMDQSCSIFGVKNHALLIDFYPHLRPTTVQFPSDATEYAFVIAHSLVTANKHVSAPYCYNLRVAECRLAAAVLAKKLGLMQPSVHREKNVLTRGVTTLRSVQELFNGRMLARDGGSPSQDQKMINFVDAAQMKSELQAMLKITAEIFGAMMNSQNDGLSLQEIADILEMSVAEVEETLLDNKKFPIDVDHDYGPGKGRFQLWKRSEHVFSEALRVYLMRECCDTQSKSGGDNALDTVWHQMGQLMNQSQESCQGLFNCSHPNLDYLISVCRKNGALGSRLTGAGWGGCCVSLVKKSNLESFISGVEKEYYFAQTLPSGVSDISAAVQQQRSQMEKVIFWTTAGTGAIVYQSQ